MGFEEISSFLWFTFKRHFMNSNKYMYCISCFSKERLLKIYDITNSLWHSTVLTFSFMVGIRKDFEPCVFLVSFTGIPEDINSYVCWTWRGRCVYGDKYEPQTFPTYVYRVCSHGEGDRGHGSGVFQGKVAIEKYNIVLKCL